jgi:hypothetical protein
MRVLVAIVIGGLAVVLLLAGVSGSGQQLFGTLFGKGTPKAKTSGFATAADKIATRTTQI